MSGFGGIAHNNGRNIDPSTSASISASLQSLGPDRSGQQTLGHAVLCHSLLRASFWDDADPQPLSLNEKVWIIADARLDGRADLIALLNSKGINVSTENSDARLILEAFHVWGTDCTDHLMGDFAFAIWDDERRELFCARDQLAQAKSPIR